MENIPLFDNDDYLAIEQLDFPNSKKKGQFITENNGHENSQNKRS